MSKCVNDNYTSSDIVLCNGQVSDAHLTLCDVMDKLVIHSYTVLCNGQVSDTFLHCVM